jgi:hypothetical protein
MSRDSCSRCDAKAPGVRTAGTLADLGWRMVVNPKATDPLESLVWLCPACAERQTGSAPLSRPKGG